MRLVDDEELVGALEQVVRLARHRVLDDFDEIFGAHGVGVRVLDAEQDRAAPALVVRRNGKRVERARGIALR